MRRCRNIEVHEGSAGKCIIGVIGGHGSHSGGLIQYFLQRISNMLYHTSNPITNILFLLLGNPQGRHPHPRTHAHTRNAHLLPSSPQLRQ